MDSGTAPIVCGATWNGPDISMSRSRTFSSLIRQLGIKANGSLKIAASMHNICRVNPVVLPEERLEALLLAVSVKGRMAALP